MQVSDVHDQIRNFIVKQFPLARNRDLKDDEGLLENGIVDSLGVLDLVAFLEHEFGISISDNELLPENFTSIDRLAVFVQEKKWPGPAGPESL